MNNDETIFLLGCNILKIWLSIEIVPQWIVEPQGTVWWIQNSINDRMKCTCWSSTLCKSGDAPWSLTSIRRWPHEENRDSLDTKSRQTPSLSLSLYYACQYFINAHDNFSQTYNYRWKIVNFMWKLPIRTNSSNTYYMNSAILKQLFFVECPPLYRLGLFSLVLSPFDEQETFSPRIHPLGPISDVTKASRRIIITQPVWSDPYLYRPKSNAGNSSCNHQHFPIRSDARKRSASSVLNVVTEKLKTRTNANERNYERQGMRVEWCGAWSTCRPVLPYHKFPEVGIGSRSTQRGCFIDLVATQFTGRPEIQPPMRTFLQTKDIRSIPASIFKRDTHSHWI